MNTAETLAVLSAALCVAGGLWSLCTTDEALRRARLMFADCGRPPVGPPGWARWQSYAGQARAVLERGRKQAAHRLGVPVGPEVLCLPAGLLLGLLTHSPLPPLAGAVAMPLLGRQLRAQHRRSENERWQESVITLCTAVAGDLRAGRPPDAALADAVERMREARGFGDPQAGECMSRLLAAARFGGDVPAALRQAARRPGAYGLAAAAACWEVATVGGAGLADGLDRVAAALRAERDQLEELRAALAGPRSTAAMLALLPVFGLVLGWTMGAQPLRVLLHTPSGQVCLAVGVVLEGLGLLWTSSIARAAEKG
ncbi:type II secretion system F family protein [Streptomyces sp. RB6PN25]|uniref:Type II secretion system F family protein n=1 Tax=Streptomyces humicola TaxID=2953240 RepID=A0ABT1PX87_9ACTN|nr:type II secretion system F family protein [Streptomyces humicola]MCQ4081155.1 type II secretion system F family protein [Streptomyces humicola]